jgi:hypothetical protein
VEKLKTQIIAGKSIKNLNSQESEEGVGRR